MKKRILSLVMAVLLFAGLLPAASVAADLPFIDVSPEAWYYNDVKNAVDSGLVNGKTAETYCPNDNLTYAEAVKLAACMHQKYTTGVVSLVNGDPWYKSYVDYAKMNAIIAKDYDWNAKATRAGYMAIFASALPDYALAAKNEVPDGSIPDVSMSHPQAKAIYKLYRAGILQGSDDMYGGAWTKHLCKPENNIQRSEVAAILTRMMYAAERLSFSMGETPKTDALTVTKQPASYTLKAPEEEVSFTVEISGGKAPYTYKWVIEKETGTNPTAAESEKTKSTFKVGVKKNSYEFSKYIRVYCEITDAAGAKVTTEKAEITPYSEGLTIKTQPADFIMKKAGDKNFFTVEISGGKAPYKYQWIEELEGTIVWGVHSESKDTKSTYALRDAHIINGVKVYVVVTDAEGRTVTSEKAEFTYILTITTQPGDYTMKKADELPVFSVKVYGGKAPYTYSWFFDTNEYHGSGPAHISGETSDLYLITDPDALAKSGEYVRIWCRITDAVGNEVDSEKAVLYRFSDALKITTQPEDFTMQNEDDIPVFSVSVSGGKAPYTYLWYIDTDMHREIGPTHSTDKQTDLYLITDPFSLAEPGEYIWIWCHITDADGNEVDSEKAVLYRFS